MIIAQLTQANAALAAQVPELEAPQEARGVLESSAEEPERAERPPDTAEWPVRGALLRPWWRRVLRWLKKGETVAQTPDGQI